MITKMEHKMTKKFSLYSLLTASLLTQAGCAGDFLRGTKKIELNPQDQRRELKCKELKTHVGMANHQVKMVEREAQEKLGARFNNSERSLRKHPDLLNTYSISLDNLAQAVQNYKSEQCN